MREEIHIVMFLTFVLLLSDAFFSSVDYVCNRMMNSPSHNQEKTLHNKKRYFARAEALLESVVWAITNTKGPMMYFVIEQQGRGRKHYHCVFEFSSLHPHKRQGLTPPKFPKQ